MSNHRRWFIVTGSALLVFVSGVVSALAADIDSQAEKVLRSMTEYANVAKSFRIEVNATYKVQSNSINNKATFIYIIAGAQPNRLVTTVRAGDGAPVVISDGKQLYTYAPALEKYVLKDAPETFAEILANKSVQATGLAHSLFAGMLLPFNSYEDLAATLDQVEYVGDAKIVGVKCHHLRVAQESYGWDLWIDAGKKPIIRKLEPNLSKWIEANPGMISADTKVEAQFLIKTFQIDAPLKDKDFKIAPPPMAVEVASLAPAAGERQPRPAELLKGKPAPLFQAAILGGGVANLSSHQGREVVILDFWATWCGPCVRSLPAITEVAAAYRSRGVAFYAVNCKEDPATIFDFLKAQQLNLPVVLDQDGAVAKLYRVTGIPQTVIIGKDGEVHVVHIGAGDGIKQTLSAELDAILAKGSNKK